MCDRPYRLDTQHAGIKPLAQAIASEQQKPLTQWTVQLMADGGEWCGSWKWETHVLAPSSTAATARARADFYDGWATSPEDRERLPLRVLAVMQEGI